MSTKDPNVFDSEDYYEMSMDDRCKLDEWLKSLGGRPNITKTLILDPAASKVTCVEYVIEKNGTKDYTRGTIEGEIEVTFSYTEGPPVWKDY